MRFFKVSVLGIIFTNYLIDDCTGLMRVISKSKFSQKGSSLLELVVVIIIIGIISAIAIPKFQDLIIATERAATKATASELSAAASVAYTKYKIDKTPMPTSCADFGQYPYVENNLSSSYTISGTVPDCSITGPTGENMKFFVPN